MKGNCENMNGTNFRLCKPITIKVKETCPFNLASVHLRVKLKFLIRERNVKNNYLKQQFYVCF